MGNTNTSVGFDWDKLSTASTSLQTQLTSFDDAVEAIFTAVTNMGGSWTGPSYDAFLKYCTEYRKNTITPLSNEVKTWVSNLATLSNSASETSKNNASLFGGNN